MKFFLLAPAFIFGIFLQSAVSAEVTVSGNAYSDSQCHYYSGSSAEFWVGIEEAGLSGLTLHYAFSGTDQGRAVSWYRPKTVAMLPERGERYTAKIVESVDNRGGYYLSHLQFYYEGAAGALEPKRSSYFQVSIPQRECVSSGLKSLPVSVIRPGVLR